MWYESLIQKLRSIVEMEMERVAKLGDWPSYIDVEKSLLGRVPTEESTAPGFDAGIACCLDLIPEDKQKLSATLHAAYTQEAVEQVREEIQTLDPDSETTWWLAMSAICRPGGVTEEKFLDQVKYAAFYAAHPGLLPVNAERMLKAMKDRYVVRPDGVAYGTEMGAAQAAYIAGHDLAVEYNKTYGIYFIATFRESLGLEEFQWADGVDEKGLPTSGPVHGSRQFVKAATVKELKAALEIAKKHLGL